MRFAGFWQRLGAAIVDLVVLVPPLLLLSWLAGGSIALEIPEQIVSTGVALLYPLYCHAKWGQTVGKRALDIKVVTTSGAPIGWRESLLRSSVEGVLTLIALAGTVYALSQVDSTSYQAAGWLGRARILEQSLPAWTVAVNVATSIWVWGELITMLSNRRRRAIHDFIAGTVVAAAPIAALGSEPAAPVTNA